MGITREKLIAAMQATASPKLVPVTVEPWGALYVKPQTVEEADEASEFKAPPGTKQHNLARGAARIICDEDGNRIFDPNNESDVELLSKQIGRAHV